jgi:hypothetical protein
MLFPRVKAFGRKARLSLEAVAGLFVLRHLIPKFSADGPSGHKRRKKICKFGGDII